MQSGLPVSVNVSIERGASVSGTVLFDDGSPAIGLNVTVLAHSKNSWVPFGMQPVGGPNTFTTTDDQGNYRIARLPARDYLVQITFSRSTEIFHFDERGRASSSSNSSDSLSFYSGGKSRQSGAGPFSLSPGEDLRGEDIQIPLSKLHSVRGSITAARDGHLPNGGSLTLLHADDKSMLSGTSLTKDEEEFTFSFVPEGDYILRVNGAADVDYVEKPNPPGSIPSSYAEPRFLRTYGSADQLIHVTSDLTGILVAVPDLGEMKNPPPNP